jgi:tRNA pseudouridine55 synthase
VRALARDIGRALGCFGHVISLRRTQVGAFSEDDAITLDELRDLAADGGSGPEGAVMEALRPITSVLDDVFVVNVSQSDAARLRCGQAVLLRGRDAPIVSGTACALFKGDPVAVAEIVKGCLRPTRVFNLS